MLTYEDGVGAERCTQCSAVVRHGGEPIVSILRSDAESLASFLVEYVDCPEVWDDTIKRLERVVGRTVKQMQAARMAAAGDK